MEKIKETKNSKLITWLQHILRGYEVLQMFGMIIAKNTLQHIQTDKACKSAWIFHLIFLILLFPERMSLSRAERILGVTVGDNSDADQQLPRQAPSSNEEDSSGDEDHFPQPTEPSRGRKHLRNENDGGYLSHWIFFLPLFQVQYSTNSSHFTPPRFQSSATYSS